MLPYGRQMIDDADVAAVAKVLKNDLLTTGPVVAEFEEKFAAECGVPHAVACSSGTAALHMAVGFDRPLVALFGPTRVERVGPYRRERDVIQHLRAGDRFDHKDERVGVPMMERITTQEVLEACLARLRG